MRPVTTFQGPRTTLADPAQRLIGQPSHSSSNDKIPSLLEGNQMATVFVINGRSKGLEYALLKPRTSIGQVGSGADIEIDDLEASALHCVITGVEDADMVRLYDLGSASGTYVNDQRIQAVNISHLSEFRIGSTTLLVTIVSKHSNEKREGQNASTSGGNAVTVVEEVLCLKSKRPRARRYPFAASIELTDLETEILIKERTKDLNLFGCRVDTQKPLPAGKRVRIRITHAGRNLIALGRVVYARQSGGMGIAFTKVESSYESVLESWIAELREQGV